MRMNNKTTNNNTLHDIMKSPISVLTAINTLIVIAVLTGVYMYIVDLKSCIEFLKNTNNSLNSELISSKEIIHNLKKDLSANETEITLTKTKLEKALEDLSNKKSFFDTFQNSPVLKYTIYTLAGITGVYMLSGLLPATFNPLLLGYNKIVPSDVRYWCEDNIPLLRETFNIEFLGGPSTHRAQWVATIINKRKIDFSISPHDATGNKFNLAEYMTHITTISNETASTVIKELPLNPEVSRTMVETIVSSPKVVSTVTETVTKVADPLSEITSLIL